MAQIFVPRDRKQLFRQFLAGMYDAVVITDPNGHVIEVNPRAEEHFGYLADEMADRPIAEFVSGLSAAIVQRIRKGLEAERRMLIDGSGICKDGSRFACEVTVSVIDLMDPGDLVFTVRNVERRRKLRERLRAKENAFGIASAALFACAPDGHFTEVNDAFLEMFSLADEEVARKLVFTDLIDDDPLPANFRKALAGEKTTVGIVAEADEEDGENTEIEVVLSPSRFATRVVGVVGCITRV